MATAATAAGAIPWWKEPTKDQWMAWWAAWLGWTLDAFDFTVFLLIMVPIAKEFDVPLTAVAGVLSLGPRLVLGGATTRVPLPFALLQDAIPVLRYNLERNSQRNGDEDSSPSRA